MHRLILGILFRSPEAVGEPVGVAPNTRQLLRLPTAASVLGLVLAVSAPAQLRSPYVGGYEHQFREQPVSSERVAGGRLLLTELNCLSCHKSEGKAVSKPAPDLSGITDRTDPFFVQRYIADPHQHQPRTTMPAVLGHLPKKDALRHAEAITHYLVSLNRASFSRRAPDHVAIDRGESLYHSVGCVACHPPLNFDEHERPVSADRPFPIMAAKYSRDGLRDFLKSPHRIRPGGRMPDLLLTDGEASDIAEYLVRDTFVAGAVNYELFYGRRNGLQDRSRITAFRTGVTDGLHLRFPHRGNDFSVTLSSWLQIEEAGSYQFHLETDDAGELKIDGRSVIANDSPRNTNRVLKQTSTIKLDSGIHEIAVEYFQRGRESHFDLTWTPPGKEKSEIPAGLLRNSKRPAQPLPTWTLDEKLVPEGKRLFAASGCADCHELPGLTPRSHRSLSDVSQHLNSGCLASEDGDRGSAPQYGLDPEQQAAIRLAMSLTRLSNSENNNASQIHNTMARLQCYACHDRGVVNDVPQFGLPDDRRPWFKPQVPELGDEGRIPPSLTGVGDKLKPAWLQKVLTERGIARPYMNVRMPQFGSEQVSHLAEDFALIDRRPTAIRKTPDSDEDAKAAGLHLVDRGRLQCIGCHDFNGHKSIGIRAMDLTAMPGRLNRDWFHRYMRSPGDYRPGTKMPAAWPSGRSLFPQVLEGDANRQIDALWRYLADGRRAVPPAGLSRQSLEVIVGGEAVVYRNKIRQAGFRGICVGYPDEVNVAFDAESMRLAQIWKGRFLNASPHWNVQGMGRIGPLGHDVVTFPGGPSITRLSTATQVWPETTDRDPKFRFRGYQLDKVRRPTFEYTYDGVQVTDFCQGSLVKDKTSQRRLVRTFTFAGETDQLYVRLWAGAGVRRTSGGFVCENGPVIRSAEDGLIVRESEGRSELLLDCSQLAARSKAAEFSVEYLW